MVKSLDSQDLENARVEGVVVNTFHLASDPGTTVLKKFGGIKNFMKFDGLVTSDSGGWQVFSLIHRNKTAGSITDKGVRFTIGTKKKEVFTPEKSIQAQFAIGGDLIICLDDFTPPDAPFEKIKGSVDRTVLWAKKSKIEYQKYIQKHDLNDENRPLILAVVQGGWDRKLRKECAEKLVEIGFDGYGFGGYVIDDETKKMDLNVSKYIAELIPNDKLKFALGVGSPYEIAMCRQFGWDIFDCTLPTRDARHKRLYIFDHEPKGLKDLLDPKLYGFIYIGREVYRRNEKPISKFCDCFTCQNYSLGYLNHLFEIEDSSAFRLATIHNLRHYTKLIEYLKIFK